MPTWMNNLYQKLCDPTSHVNVKLFITKLIINTAEVMLGLEVKVTVKLEYTSLIQGDRSVDGLNNFETDFNVNAAI